MPSGPAAEKVEIFLIASIINFSVISSERIGARRYCLRVILWRSLVRVEKTDLYWSFRI